MSTHKHALFTRTLSFVTHIHTYESLYIHIYKYIYIYIYIYKYMYFCMASTRYCFVDMQDCPPGRYAQEAATASCQAGRLRSRESIGFFR